MLKRKGRAVRVEVPGFHPPGRPKKTLRQCVEEDWQHWAVERQRQ